MRKFFAGVGSRETPPDVLALLVRLGRTLTDLGWTLSSGDAVGADRAFYEGALQSPRFSEVGCRIYLAWNGVGGRYHDPDNGFYDATQFTETYPQAEALALAARGSFEGLGRGGRALHTRNVFQIYGHTLKEPVSCVLFWAVPQGRSGKVKGGTSTAVTLAQQAGIKTINLYTDQSQRSALDFLAKYETLCI